MRVCRLICDKVSISGDERRVKKKVMMVMTGFISLSFCIMPVKLETLKNYFIFGTWVALVRKGFCAIGSWSSKIHRIKGNHGETGNFYQEFIQNCSIQMI